ncbi:MAG: hypothetical protein L6V90_09425 [Treponema succinifaciens]|nr:MAG: hypothetical protein L6V90_09425 [Treponema succinifaciens]
MLQSKSRIPCGGKRGFGGGGVFFRFSARISSRDFPFSSVKYGSPNAQIVE